MDEHRRRNRLNHQLGAVALLAAAVSAGSGPMGCAPTDAVDLGEGEGADLKLAAQISVAALEQALAPDAIDARRDLAVARVSIDDLSMAHTRVQQLHDGIPVFGGEAIVHLRRDGSLFSVTDALVRGLDVDAVPDLDAAQAVERAVADHGCPACLTDEPIADLWVIRQGERDHLAYRVQLFREDGTDATSMPVIFIDASTGEKVWEYDNLQTGSGHSLYSGVQTVGTYHREAAGLFYMQDLSTRFGTFDALNATGSDFYPFADGDDLWEIEHQRAAVDVQYCMGVFYDYFMNVHGRNGIDGAGGPFVATGADGSTKVVTSRIHYGVRYNNAYWNSNTNMMTYGDGDGVAFRPLVSLDICGHEMMHGITSHTAGLVYSGESGALNESMSDVFGAMVERHARGESEGTWQIGEEVFTPRTAGDALRFMNDPHAAADKGYTANDDPAHYAERYTGWGDNGGVHINSGIPNKVFHLLAAGGSHEGGSVAGIGADSAARIWYKALTEYMTSSTDFVGARDATLLAAQAMFGDESAEVDAVRLAWSLAGVGECGAGKRRFCMRSTPQNACGPQSKYLFCGIRIQTCSPRGSWGPC
jgi:Zn-dependent metalloprotease